MVNMNKQTIHEFRNVSKEQGFRNYYKLHKVDFYVYYLNNQPKNNPPPRII